MTVHHANHKTATKAIFVSKGRIVNDFQQRHLPKTKKKREWHIFLKPQLAFIVDSWTLTDPTACMSSCYGLLNITGPNPTSTKKSQVDGKVMRC